MGKNNKYTIGENLKKEAQEIIVSIYKANSRVDKSGMIGQAREHLEMVRLYIRVSKDLKQIILKEMIFLNEFIESISKQLTGWEKAISQTKAGVAPITVGASVQIQSNSPPQMKRG